MSPLYFFAFLAGTLFFSENGDKTSFPQSLIFSRDVDVREKRLLSSTRRGKTFLRVILGQNKKWTLREVRYKEMGCGSNKIFDIFDHSYQQMTTNDAACARLSEADAFCFQISEPIYRDLLRITRRDNLKVPLALQWASHHFVYLGNEGIQSLLEHCFFAPSGLYDRLKEEPRFIESLREFCDQRAPIPSR